MSPQKGDVDGCGTGIVVLIIGVTLLALLASGVQAQEPEPWDGSNIELSYQCNPAVKIEFTATNTGAAMSEPRLWRVRNPANTQAWSSTYQLAAGMSHVWAIGTMAGETWIFEVNQDPLRPAGAITGIAVTCAPVTAITLSAFAVTTDHAGATSLEGNRGGCAPGNKIRGLACTITDFVPGYVSGTCDGGFWFGSVRTARTFTIDQAVTVQGCIMLGDRLEGVAGWPLRISK